MINMGATSLIIGFIILSVIGFGAYRLVKVRQQTRKLNEERFKRIKLLYDRFESGQEVTADHVFAYAERLETRQACYELLKQHNRSDLFPPEFYTLEKAAESSLANWLEYPTELDACPDEIEHIKRVTIDFDGHNNYVHYEVFKCRVKEPHWAATDGWFLGVVGPYFDDSKPYDFPQATFSRISSTVDKVSPEEEAKWVHENISLRR
jgi:hypothetical protein